MDDPDVIAARGWSAKGSSAYSRQFAPRQSCLWTDKEDYDLIRQLQYGVPIDWIADYHQRSLGGIDSRIADPTRAQAGYERYGRGEPQPRRGNYSKTKTMANLMRELRFAKNAWYLSGKRRKALVRDAERKIKQEQQHEQRSRSNHCA